jgi:hypothetical protein
VYLGFHTGRTPADDGPDMEIILEVTLRRVAHDGTRLLFPGMSVETFWTNLHEPPQTVVELYRDHGTSEQFHSELERDMHVERLPRPASSTFQSQSLLRIRRVFGAAVA